MAETPLKEVIELSDRTQGCTATRQFFGLDGHITWRASLAVSNLPQCLFEPIILPVILASLIHYILYNGFQLREICQRQLASGEYARHRNEWFTI